MVQKKKRRGKEYKKEKNCSRWNFRNPSSRSGQSLKSTTGNRRRSKNCEVRGKSGVVKLYLRQAWSRIMYN